MCLHVCVSLHVFACVFVLCMLVCVVHFHFACLCVLCVCVCRSTYNRSSPGVVSINMSMVYLFHGVAHCLSQI